MKIPFSPHTITGIYSLSINTVYFAETVEIGMVLLFNRDHARKNQGGKMQ
jgi:hypothetical protein